MAAEPGGGRRRTQRKAAVEPSVDDGEPDADGWEDAWSPRWEDSVPSKPKGKKTAASLPSTGTGKRPKLSTAEAPAPGAAGEGPADEGQAAPPDEPDHLFEDDAEPSSKGLRRRRKDVKAEALEPGAVVLYWGEQRGVIRDSFAPLDQFWVADEQSGSLVRDEEHEIVAFAAAELEPVATAPKPKHLLAEEGAGAQKAASVLLIGMEESVVPILEHFGEPAVDQRQTPQQLLAIQCPMLDPSRLQALASEGVDEGVKALGERLREDIHVAVRAFHLKRVASQLAPDVQSLEGYYCLGAVHLPYGREDIESCKSKRERRLREDVWCQIDLCTTAYGEYGDEPSLEAVAQRALGECCGVSIAERIWKDEVQLALRNRLGLPLLPFRLQDVGGSELFVIIIPKDAAITKNKGVLCFTKPVESKREPTAARPAAPTAAEASAAKAPAGDSIAKHMGLDGRRLPPGWERVQSRSNGKVYFYNAATKESTYDFPEAPLPRGWKKVVSKSNGKTYYFNAGRGLSQYERPTE